MIPDLPGLLPSFEAVLLLSKKTLPRTFWVGSTGMVVTGISEAGITGRLATGADAVAGAAGAGTLELGVVATGIGRKILAGFTKPRSSVRSDCPPFRAFDVADKPLESVAESPTLEMVAS